MFIRKQVSYKGDKEYTYLKLVENYRYKNKVRQRTLVNIGNIDHWPRQKVKEFIIKLSQATNVECPSFLEDVQATEVLEFGPHFLINHLWEKLALSHILQDCIKDKRLSFNIIKACKTMVFNRLINPKSKLQVFEWAKNQFIPNEGSKKEVELHHYYRALDYLTQFKERIEKAIYDKVVDLFNLDLSLIFYDLTSSYFEGEKCPLSNWGFSRDHRPDCRQIQIGLVVNRDGTPIAHEVFEGNIKDQTTLQERLDDLKSRFNIQRCIFIADNGIICNSTFDYFEDTPYKYITRLRLRHSKEGKELVNKIEAVKGFKKVKDNLYVKELHCDKAHTYIAAYNPVRAEQTRISREERIQNSECFLKQYTLPRPKHKMKKQDKLYLQITKYLKKNKTHKFFIVEHLKNGRFKFTKRTDIIAQEQKLDGMQILKTNSKELSPTEIALGYRTLSKVENAFKEIKSFLNIRPIRHFNELRVQGHVFICVIAYLLEQLLDQALEAKGSNLSATTTLEKLSPIKIVNNTLMGHTIRRVSVPTKEQKEILKLIGIDYIPTLV